MYNFRLLDRFGRSNDGNFAMITAILMIPIAIVVGLALDYSRATNERATMQNALDAASFSALSLPIDATRAQRQAELSKSYAANGGQGSAVIVGDLILGGELASLKTSASAQMKTGFMRLAARNNADIGVGTTVAKRQKLEAARFKLTEVTGWWDKKVSLFAKKKDQQAFVRLMEIDYKYNGLRGSGLTDAGVGTTTVRKLQGTSMIDVFKRDCAGVLIISLCRDVKLAGDGTAEVDLMDVTDVYLQMDISASKSNAISLLNSANPPRPIKTTNKNLANRLFIDGGQQPKGRVVDILAAVKCGEWSTQAWEDGGGFSPGQTPEQGTDFKYQVQGRCDWDDGVVGAFLKK